MGGILSGGGSNKTTTNQNPPQLLPEAREGFEQAQSFEKGILANPPIFQGQRVAPASAAQTAAFNSAATMGQPNQLRTTAENQLTSTARGDFLGGPQMQAAVSSAADPIFRRFTTDVLPGIADKSQAAGQGVSGSRRSMANQAATSDFANQLGTSVVAPIFNAERSNMLNATGQVPGMEDANAKNLMMQSTLGAQERGIGQEELQAEQQKFEEPLFRQSGAAQSLLAAGGAGPGGNSQVSTDTKGTGQMIGTIAPIAAAAIMACWIAEAIYGRNSASYWYARDWINFRWEGKVADFVRKAYIKYGKRVAKYPYICKLLKPLFDIAARKGMECSIS